MPAKHRVKEYEKNGYYHVYNRGVGKQIIFRESQDYAVFLSYLKVYLEPKNIKLLQSILLNPHSLWREKDTATKLLRLNNFFEEIKLVAYCLMPNHFHFLIKQAKINSTSLFMKSLCIRYSMYFNKKYKWVGGPFQDVFKAVRVTTEEQFLYLTRYIHRNSIENKRFTNLASQGSSLRSWPYSSYLDYIGKRFTNWLYLSEILNYFSGKEFLSYESFVGDFDENEKEITIINKLLID